MLNWDYWDKTCQYINRDSHICCAPLATEQENDAPSKNKMLSRGRGIIDIPGVAISS